MSYLFRIIKAAFTSKLRHQQTMDIEMDDCASYENFCFSISAAEKSRLSSDISSPDFDYEWASDSDSDDSDDDEDNWSRAEQSFQDDESMDDFEIVFEDQDESEISSQFQAKENRVQDEASKIEATKIAHDLPSEELSQDRRTIKFEFYFEEETSKSGFLQKVNSDWEKGYNIFGDIKKTSTKVSFAPDESLVEILPTDICDRKGEWMMYAIDRIRFEKRIQETEMVLSSCFSEENRHKALCRQQVPIEQNISDFK